MSRTSGASRRWLSILATVLPCAVCVAGPQIRTSAGLVEGVTDQTSQLNMFLGVPFAAPPVRELRWKEPHPVKSWEGVRKADHFSARCMQRPLYSDMNFRSKEISEDCLYLNIWTSAKSSSERQPVLVYFFGGGFRAGDASEYRYDGASMAKRGITTVTVNYRLDVFGMLAHPWLTQESPHHASGNYALLDQAAALKWVKQNIAAFGGDPNRVTIAGESAGSISVSALMASHLSRGLIAGAIGESGSMLGRGTVPSLADAETKGVAFAQFVKALSVEELRAIPAGMLLEAAAAESAPRLDLIVDGYFFPKTPADIYQAGEQAHVPLLAGTNSQESGFDAVLGPNPPTLDNYKQALHRMFGDKADRVLQLYPAATDQEVMDAATELASDRFLGYSTWQWVETHGKTAKGQPTFYYFYSRPRPTPVNPAQRSERGAVHSAEIEYAMGNLDTNKVFAWSPEDHKVSETMQSYFANFIKRRDPNGPGLPKWDAYNKSDTHPRLTIDVDTRLEPDTRRPRYELAEQLSKR
jgi:para-nitrobenzyl esterase